MGDAIEKLYQPIYTVYLNVPECHHKTVDELLDAAVAGIRPHLDRLRADNPERVFKIAFSAARVLPDKESARQG